MKYTIEELDMMEGHEFEYAVADLLHHNGWRDVKVTQGSGDYGIDILARRKNIKYAIQCKRYGSTVGVKAVQEAGLGTDFYHCDAAAVITNSKFSKQALNLAQATGVRLWDRGFLLELINKYDDEYDEIAPQFAQTNLHKENETQQQIIDSGRNIKKYSNNKITDDKGIELAKNIYIRDGQIYLNKDKISYKGLKVFNFFLHWSALLIIIMGLFVMIFEPLLGIAFVAFGICFFRYHKRIKQAIYKYEKLKEK